MPPHSVQPWLELCWLGYHRLTDINASLREVIGIDIEYGEVTWTKIAISEEEVETQRSNLNFFRSEGYYEPYWLERDELRSIYPNINRNVRGALASPCLQVEPYKFTLGLAQAAENASANIRQGEVIGFRHIGSRVSSLIMSTGTQVEADIIVLAMGPWSKQGTSWLDKEIPLRINREQCLRVQMPNRFPPYALRGPKVGIIPKVNGEIIMGISGAEDLQTQYTIAQTTEETKVEILEAAVELLPELKDAKLIEHRGDLESWPPPPQSVKPLIGRLPRWDNVYLATGFGTEGIMMSLGAGQLAADLITNSGNPSTRFRVMAEHLDPRRQNNGEVNNG
jgi:glycine/D-amino acid oxidase-like deaminating enzyme